SPEIWGVQIEVGPQLAAERADVSHIQGHLRSEVARHREGQVLDGRRKEARIEGIEEPGSVRHRNHCTVWIRQESRLDRYQARVGDELLETEIGTGTRDAVRCVAAAGRIADCGVEDESASTAEELDLVSATHRRLPL